MNKLPASSKGKEETIPDGRRGWLKRKGRQRHDDCNTRDTFDELLCDVVKRRLAVSVSYSARTMVVLRRGTVGLCMSVLGARRWG